MSNISDLSITIAEVARASNLTINTINLTYTNKKMILSKPFDVNFYFKSLFIIVIISILIWAIYTMISTGLSEFMLFIYQVGFPAIIMGIILVITISYLLAIISKQSDDTMRNRFKHFLKLYIQVLNFNSLIESAEALDEAGRSGGSNRLENRDKVIKALTSIRADLISALRIEKAFRENPNFSSSSFTPNLEPLQVLQLSEQSSEYGRLFNEALQIGMNVQEEMQTLQRR